MLKSDGTASEDFKVPYARTDVWQNLYEQELKQFDDTKTVGEEWYEVYQQKIIEWIDESWSHWSSTDRSEAIVLDIGTGNGLMLARLGSLGFGRLYGTDYLPAAIECAVRFRAALQEGSLILDDCDGPSASSARFAVDDIMAETCCPGERFDAAELRRLFQEEGGPHLIHDKGTLDVFYLRGQMPEMIRQVDAKYAQRRSAPVLWLISSGNLTPDELVAAVTSHSAFEELERLQAQATLTFGGAEGTTISTVIFRKPPQHSSK